MRKTADILKDIGFNKDSSLDVQSAFVRHLIQHAQKPESVPPKDAQLSFDEDILSPWLAGSSPPKIRAR